MKPLHVFLLLFAIFITALADGISFGLSILPGVGLIIGLALTFCINITMGSGLILLLVMNGMYHPKWGPAGFVGGSIPGLDFLPFWLGVVIAGIMHDMAKEKSALGTVAKLSEDLGGIYKGDLNPLSKAGGAAGAVMRAAQPQASMRDVPQNGEQPQERTPSTMQTKKFDGIKPYVPKTA